ncbi:uncharacterized protein LY89DRAFT_17232 [Mollisia scopiformis]|uniref:Uncharacterized protein n=1 Tax=Mollisia scopiformis TaxID=149040 RepID=A0A194XVY5_MOLSC|nr:uncharacterized protein LY89DRAFT_17232 [Mollisia scopiformis]KUJ24296.1 hypothetical protein LY89DRAFT_17232 [Mollisia scopiformis]
MLEPATALFQEYRNSSEILSRSDLSAAGRWQTSLFQYGVARQWNGGEDFFNDENVFFIFLGMCDVYNSAVKIFLGFLLKPFPLSRKRIRRAACSRGKSRC